MVYGLASRNPARYRPVYLYWAGSILFSLAMLLPGGFIGSHSHNVQASTLLNTPYVLMPLLFVKRVLDTPRPALPAVAAPKAVALIFALLFATIIGATFVRYAAAADSEWQLAVLWRKLEPVLHEPSRFFHLFACLGHFYEIPLLAATALCLLCGANASQSGHLSDALLFLAGGMAETTFTFVVAATHRLMPEEFHVDEKNTATFYAINAAIVLGVHVVAVASLRLRLFRGIF